MSCFVRFSLHVSPLSLCVVFFVNIFPLPDHYEQIYEKEREHGLCLYL